MSGFISPLNKSFLYFELKSPLNVKSEEEQEGIVFNYLPPPPSSFRTPLMLAVSGGHVDAVSLLLEREANVNAASKHGLTALHLGVSIPVLLHPLKNIYQHLRLYIYQYIQFVLQM